MKSLDAKYVQDEITSLLLVHPELAEDEVLRADSIEGETGAFEFLSRIVRKIEETVTLSDAIEKYVNELEAREARFGRRIDALRSLITKVMNTAGLRKAELPEATLSIRAGTPKVIIINDAELPDIFLRVKKEPDKQLIKAALMAHENVPGAVLSNAEPVLAVLVR